MSPLNHDPRQYSTIPFTKASAYGNDFLIIEAALASGDLNELTRQLCERHRGVGADGVEWLYPDEEADVMARLINADGSDAEISGNGTRCVAADICSRESKTQVVVRTGAGLKICRFISREGATFEFEAEMGDPEMGEQVSIDVVGTRIEGTRVSMGNPHFVIFVDNFPDAWQQEAAIIGKQSPFPRGTNVEYVAVRGANEIEIRLYERGVGETQSSGTGSCASAVAAIASGRAASPVTVIAPGGPQTVRWEDQIYLQGPATIVCRGEFFI
jgi:diaminopimelate epimerase